MIRDIFDSVCALRKKRRSEEPELFPIAKELQAWADLIASEGWREGQPMQLLFGFVDDPTFNGFAYTFEGIDVIGLNAGAYKIPIGIFRTLLSHPTFLPNIGNPAMCVPRYRPAELGLIPRYSEAWDCSVLGCPIRDALALRFAKGAIYQAFFHEVAHIWAGHVDFLRSRRSRGEAVLPLTRQTLEWDADTYSTGILLRLNLNPRTEMIDGRTKWFLGEKNDWGDDKIAIITTTIIVSTYFLLKSDYKELYDSNWINAGYHPPESFRRNSTGATIARNLEFRAGFDFNTSIEIAAIGLKMMIDTLKDAFPGFDIGSPTREEIFGSDNKYKDIAILYNDEWDRIYSELNKFKRGGVLAPSRENRDSLH